jgi:hypothetical protein
MMKRRMVLHFLQCDVLNYTLQVWAGMEQEDGCAIILGYYSRSFIVLSIEGVLTRVKYHIQSPGTEIGLRQKMIQQE